MGGKTTSSTGTANQEGVGGVADQMGDEQQETAEESRVESGYGGDRDMDTEIGA